MMKLRRMTKHFALLMVFAMMILAAGCGGDSEPTANNSTPTPPANQEANQEVGEKALFDLLAQGAEIDGLSFDSVVSMPDGTSMTSKMWVEGENMRIESSIPEGGGDAVYIVNKADQAMYLYQSAENVATKMAFSDDQFSTPLDESENIMADTITKYLGQETIDGKTCLVYEVTDEEYTSKMWVWEENGIPLRVEGVTGGGTYIVEYQNVEIGDIDDDMFELPAGAQIIDMSSMAIPEMPAQP